MATMRPATTPTSRKPDAVLIDERAAGKNQIVGSRHVRLARLRRWAVFACANAPCKDGSGLKGRAGPLTSP